MLNQVPVGLGEFKVSQRPEDILVAYGLGSCLAVGMYDPTRGIAGLLHAVLPTSNGEGPYSPKYVDSGIRVLMNTLTQHGANRYRTTIYLAGGASVLALSGYTHTFNIGSRNIAAAYEFLAGERLPVTGSDIGGKNGRTVRLYVSDGRVTVRSMGQPEKEI